MNVELDFVFLNDAVAHCFQMQLAHTAQNGLPVYRSCPDSDGRVLFSKIAQSSLKALAVSIPAGADDRRDYGTVVGVRFAQGVASQIYIPQRNSRMTQSNCMRRSILRIPGAALREVFFIRATLAATIALLSRRTISERHRHPGPATDKHGLHRAAFGTQGFHEFFHC